MFRLVPQRLARWSTAATRSNLSCEQNVGTTRCTLSTSAEPMVLVTEDSSTGVRRVTLNNPRKRNALSLAMIRELKQSLVEKESLRAVVIAANGDKVFSSGHDLKELRGLSDASSRQQVFDQCTEMMLALRQLPVPVICQVDGLAAAAGCQLVASCDIVLATDRSSFSTPGADVGLFCSTPGIAVSRVANLRTTAFMVFTGHPISATEAFTAGLITRVLSQDQLQTETDAILDSILAKSRSVIALGKKFFYHQLNLSLTEAYREGGCVMVDNLSLRDCQQGIDAFLGKRSPRWTHSEERH